MIRSSYYGNDYLDYSLDGHYHYQQQDTDNDENNYQCDDQSAADAIDFEDSIHEEHLINDEEFDEEFSRETLKRTKDKKTLSQKIYIDPVVLNKEIAKYYETGILTDTLSTMIFNIAHKLSFRKNFYGYSYREDMVSDTFCHLLNVLSKKNFDVKKGNSFSYFTKVAFHAFVAYIKKQEDYFNNLQEWRKETLAQIESEQGLPSQKNNQIIRQRDLELF